MKSGAEKETAKEIWRREIERESEKGGHSLFAYVAGRRTARAQRVSNYAARIRSPPFPLPFLASSISPTP